MMRLRIRTDLIYFSIVSSLFFSPANHVQAATSTMTSKQCQSWKNLVTKLGQENGGLASDQIQIMNAKGETLFSWTDGAFKKSTPHQLWSASKTITATIVATAVQEGRIQLSDKLSKFFPLKYRRNQKFRNEYDQVTIGDLIAMTSGFKWNEHPDASPTEISILPLLYSEGYLNITDYILQLDFDGHPGSIWNYSSANANLVMAILKKVYGSQYDKLPWKNLFDPLGIKSAHIEQDGAGTFIGAAYVYLSAEDLARIGVLFLNDGVNNGKRLLPADWLALSHLAVPASLSKIKSKKNLTDEPPYGQTGFWLNKSVSSFGKPIQSAPENLLQASGYFGQWLFVLPDQGLAIARTGHDSNPNEKLNKFVSGAIACFAQ